MDSKAPQGTVLYVEDDASDRFFMQTAFEHAGFADAFRAVGNGREAQQYLSGSEIYADRARFPFPALMLLDLNLPLISGFAVLEWMRTKPELADLPVVVFSSSTRPEDKARAAELGARDYIEKPTSGSKFGDVVESLIKRWLGQVERK